MTTRYPPLSWGARRRLEAFRKEAQNPAYVRPMTWRDVRFATLRSPTGLDQGSNGAAPIWYGPPDVLSRVRKSHEVLPHMRHTGWLTEHDGTTYKDGTGLVVGVVALLSHGRCIAGYLEGGSGDAVWFPEVFTDAEDAARAGDAHAESIAETMREESEKWRRARDLEGEIETAMRRLRECIALRHRECMAYVRDEVRDIVETIRGHRETLRTDLGDYA